LVGSRRFYRLVSEDWAGNADDVTLVALAPPPVDIAAPITTSDAKAVYVGAARISLTSVDIGDSGVAATFYDLDGTQQTYSGPVSITQLGTHTLEYWSVDNAGNEELPHQRATFEIVASDPVSADLPDGTFEVAGATRYTTAIEASKRAYPNGASTVVIATGGNWPDALGGAALAGVVEGPLLLTTTNALPDAVLAEVARLKATDAFILGGTGAVSTAVENTLNANLSGDVTRLAGANRYGTANAVADEVIELSEETADGFGGDAFIATGANFPDALGASPLAASSGTPILLAPTGGTPYLPDAVDSAVILGGTGAVTSATEAAVKTELGAASVTRVGGTDRYDTAALVAEHGVASGMRWDGVGIATGAAFPDALSGGAMLGSFDSVLLLTRPTSLVPVAEQRLAANKASIDTVFFIGGTGAVSQAVRDKVAQVLQ